METVREVGVRIELDAHDPTDAVVAVAAAASQPLAAERLTIELDGEPVAFQEKQDEYGSRLQIAATGPGRLSIGYHARLTGRAVPPPVGQLDAVVYVRPSRYVQSDALAAVARDAFAGLDGMELVTAVEEWVHGRLSYRPEASDPTGGAVETLDAGAGVCRDYAHVTAAMLRARDLPARLVSVYAPELDPMDFHAVVEALVDGRWVVVDATRLAPRSGMVRIATGRDAADVAFVSTSGSDVSLLTLEVTASADRPLGPVDPAEVVVLG